MLPQLRKENFSRKGQFNRILKLLVQNFSSSFSHFSANQVKEHFQNFEEKMQEAMKSAECKQFVENLLQYKENKPLSLNEGIVSYMLSQFADICQAHALQLKDLQLLANSHSNAYYYLLEYLEMERHLKFLFKKVTHLMPFAEAFTELVQQSNILGEEIFQQYAFAADYLSLQILEQLWNQIMFEPNLEVLSEFLKQVITQTHQREKLDEFTFKAGDLKKALKIIKINEEN